MLSDRLSSFDGIGNRRLIAAAIWLACAGGAAYLFFFQPGRTGFFPGCPFRALTGLNCPGCGTTRALHQLLHGHIIAAFELNPLTFLLWPFLACCLIIYTRSAITGRPLPRMSLSPTYGWILMIAILGFWVFRNTAAYPFPLQ
jgi:hypothetical protein